MLRKRIRIGSRSVSLATLLTLLVTISALAWAAFVAFNYYNQATVTFSAAPEPVVMSFSSGACNVDGGSGSAVVTAGSWDAGTQTFSCEYIDVDDASTLRMVSALVNENAFAVVASIGTIDPSPCFDTSANGPLVIEPASNGILELLMNGNAGTVDCAGQTLPFESVYIIEAQ